MKCPQCGTENAPGDKFCEQCGTPLSASAPDFVDDAAATMVGGPPAAATLVRSDDPSQTFPLGTRVVVGRLDTCDIPIHDKSVSREHARLSQLPGGYVVEDLGSTNGTLVNGEPISEAVILRPGDSVTFGSIDFTFNEERAATGDAASVDSTQPFQYRPAAQPVEAEPPFISREPASQPPAQFAPLESPQGASEVTADQGAPAFEFPPLQPFPPADEPVTANSQPPPPAPSPVEAQAAPSGTASPVTPPDPGPAPQVDQAPAAQAPPMSPIPPSPTTLPAPEPAPALQTSPAFVADGGTLPDDVVAAAAHLSNLVQALAQRAGQSDARLAESEARVRDLQARASRADNLTAALRDIPQPSADDSQVESMHQVLDQLAQNPRDIELLMQVGRHAADLSTVLGEYVQMRQALLRLSAAGSS